MGTATNDKRRIDLYVHPDSLEPGERLLWLVEANREIERRKANLSRETAELEAEAMAHPVTREKAFRLFGAAIGFVPTVAIFTRIALDATEYHPGRLGFFLLGILSSITTSAVGFGLGAKAGRAIAKLESNPIPVYLFFLVLVGAAWGAIAGIAGGSIIFLVGGVFGALFGAAIGAATVPVFSILFRLVSKADTIERKHLAPLAVGVSLICAAFFLGALT